MPLDIDNLEISFDLVAPHADALMLGAAAAEVRAA
jgi:hypothetical protein